MAKPVSAARRPRESAVESSAGRTIVKFYPCTREGVRHGPHSSRLLRTGVPTIYCSGPAPGPDRVGASLPLPHTIGFDGSTKIVPSVFVQKKRTPDEPTLTGWASAQ